jgi:2-polyprenyl-3-methyl-5-hydroxy-6-metoxy-1,4-benzoquinol methylase
MDIVQVAPLNQNRKLSMPAIRKVIRSCIICGCDRYEEKFVYTYQFMTQVRGHAETTSDLKGWTPETTSTIVQCSECDCYYIRDVTPPVLETKDLRKNDSLESSEGEHRPDSVKKWIQSRRRIETYKNYPLIDAGNWIVRNLCLLATRKQRRDIRVLDFGAGGGQMCNAARASGVHDVFAYDPFYDSRVQERFDGANFSGIQCILTSEGVSDHAPYDVVIFQGAVEHVLDPRAELQLIFDNMTPGGYLYVNNPVMDLGVELADLKSTKKIIKSDLLSHYHPWHLNYMMPKTFEKLLKEVGFKVLPTVLHIPPAAPGAGVVGRKMIIAAKTGIRWLQNALG